MLSNLPKALCDSCNTIGSMLYKLAELPNRDTRVAKDVTIGLASFAAGYLVSYNPYTSYTTGQAFGMSSAISALTSIALHHLAAPSEQNDKNHIVEGKVILDGAKKSFMYATFTNVIIATSTPEQAARIFKCFFQALIHSL